VINEKPLTTDWSVLQLAICIEIARIRGRVPEMPEDLREPYFQSLATMPKIIEAASSVIDPNYLIVLRAATAVVNGDVEKAESILYPDEE
jgi:hypothetical protein